MEYDRISRCGRVQIMHCRCYLRFKRLKLLSRLKNNNATVVYNK